MKKLPGLCVLALITTAACTEQFDPSHARDMFENERITANAATPRLTEDGKLPSEAEEKPFDVAETYAQLCSSCHGMNGKADTAGALALNPRPRNFTDKAWQNVADDQRIYTVIKDGGSALGLSPTMVSFAGVLNTEEKLNAMVKHVRSFNK